MKPELVRINERIAELTVKANDSLSKRNATTGKEWDNYNIDFIIEDAKLGAFILCKTLIEKSNTPRTYSESEVIEIARNAFEAAREQKELHPLRKENEWAVDTLVDTYETFEDYLKSNPIKK